MESCQGGRVSTEEQPQTASSSIQAIPTQDTTATRPSEGIAAIRPRSILKCSDTSASELSESVQSCSSTSIKRSVSWKADKDFEIRVFEKGSIASPISSASTPKVAKMVEKMKSRKDVADAIKTVVPSSTRSKRKEKPIPSSSSTTSPISTKGKGNGKNKDDSDDDEDDDSVTETEDSPPPASSSSRKRKKQSIDKDEYLPSPSVTNNNRRTSGRQGKKKRMVSIPGSALSTASTTAIPDEEEEKESDTFFAGRIHPPSRSITKRDYSTSTKASLRASTLAASASSSQAQSPMSSPSRLFANTKKPVSKKYGKNPQSSRGRRGSGKEKEEVTQKDGKLEEEHGSDTESDDERPQPKRPKRVPQTPSKPLSSKTAAETSTSRKPLEQRDDFDKEGKDNATAICIPSSSSTSTHTEQRNINVDDDETDEDLPEISSIFPKTSSKAVEKSLIVAGAESDNAIPPNIEGGQQNVKENEEFLACEAISQTLELNDTTEASNPSEKIEHMQEDEIPSPYTPSFDLPALLDGRSPELTEQRETEDLAGPSTLESDLSKTPSPAHLAADKSLLIKAAGAGMQEAREDINILSEPIEGSVADSIAIPSAPAVSTSKSTEENSTESAQPAQMVHKESSVRSSPLRTRLPRAASTRTLSRVAQLRKEETNADVATSSNEIGREGTPELPVAPHSRSVASKKRKLQREETELSLPSTSQPIKKRKGRPAKQKVVEPPKPTCRMRKRLHKQSSKFFDDNDDGASISSLEDFVARDATRTPRTFFDRNHPNYVSHYEGLSKMTFEESAMRYTLQPGTIWTETPPTSPHMTFEELAVSEMPFQEKLERRPGYGLDLLLYAATSEEARTAEEEDVAPLQDQIETPELHEEEVQNEIANQSKDTSGLSLLWEAIVQRHPDIETSNALSNQLESKEPITTEEMGDDNDTMQIQPAARTPQEEQDTGKETPPSPHAKVQKRVQPMEAQAEETSKDMQNIKTMNDDSPSTPIEPSNVNFGTNVPDKQNIIHDSPTQNGQEATAVSTDVSNEDIVDTSIQFDPHDSDHVEEMESSSIVMEANDQSADRTPFLSAKQAVGLPPDLIDEAEKNEVIVANAASSPELSVEPVCPGCTPAEKSEQIGEYVKAAGECHLQPSPRNALDGNEESDVLPSGVAVVRVDEERQNIDNRTFELARPDNQRGEELSLREGSPSPEAGLIEIPTFDDPFVYDSPPRSRDNTAPATRSTSPSRTRSALIAAESVLPQKHNEIRQSAPVRNRLPYRKRVIPQSPTPARSLSPSQSRQLSPISGNYTSQASLSPQSRRTASPGSLTPKRLDGAPDWTAPLQLGDNGIENVLGIASQAGSPFSTPRFPANSGPLAISPEPTKPSITTPSAIYEGNYEFSLPPPLRSQTPTVRHGLSSPIRSSNQRGHADSGKVGPASVPASSNSQNRFNPYPRPNHSQAVKQKSYPPDYVTQLCINLKVAASQPKPLRRDSSTGSASSTSYSNGQAVKGMQKGGQRKVDGRARPPKSTDKETSNGSRTKGRRLDLDMASLPSSSVQASRVFPK